MKPETHTKVIELRDLKRERRGVTAAIGTSWAEAACVCLKDQLRSNPANLVIRGEANSSVTLEWDEPTQTAVNTFNDEEFATEFGAYGIACLLAEEILGLEITKRARKGNGFDFWLSPVASTQPGLTEEKGILQNLSRLEVSGIRSGSNATISARVRQKESQVRDCRPAYVAVVEFGQPCSVMKSVR